MSRLRRWRMKASRSACVGGIQAVVVFSPLRGWQQALAFVKADRLNRGAGQLGQIANAHAEALFFWGVTLHRLPGFQWQQQVQGRVVSMNKTSIEYPR